MAPRAASPTAAGRSRTDMNGARTVQVWVGLSLLAGILVSPAATWGQSAPPPQKDRFEAADKNRDGRVDREEFYRVAVESFYFRDKTRKGYLTVEELREASPEAFKAANRKGDGRLSLEEYVNALFVDFDRADTSKDGALTWEEFEAYSRSGRR